ncbi:HesA/MoeB/ThiF family protein [Paraferrimonas sp. SM1919]|uniref:HesA/MoeB/ThiF family protein n=1 Tax=Paraferrimonas sp. SM1919 TaxID=2662263 RepID=UPI0013D07EA8|nr:HesA/MoeB/ThiF family protein [Paraferrimonas sp. SM1919]
MYHSQQVRYARNISLPEIGEQGQQKLLDASVLVIGAGGLGAPLLQYLASSGVGKITVIDDDYIELSNLQRQTLFEEADIGCYKANVACERLYDINPDLQYEAITERLTEDNAQELISKADIVADGCDNFETRFLVAKTCMQLRVPLVSAAVMGLSGQLSTFKPYLGGEHPCYQCFYPELPSPEATPKCHQSGVLAPVVGVLGSMQAMTVIKEIVGIEPSLSGTMVIFDGGHMELNKFNLPKLEQCPACSEQPTNIVNFRQ